MNLVNYNNTNQFSYFISLILISVFLLIQNDGSGIHLTLAQIPPDEPLTIHIVPHTHDDSGWLKTFEDYYVTQVQNILNTVVSSLQSDPSKTFAWCEIGYLERWFTDPNVNSEYKELFKSFVQQKRIEFVGGGYVQNDEACPNIESIIAQMTQGFDFISNNFGPEHLPETAWQIDPFGFSAASAAIYSQLGMKQVVINRIKTSNKSTMKQNNEMQFIWRGNPNLGESSDIFAHVLDDHYSTPKELAGIYLPYNSYINGGVGPELQRSLQGFVDSIRRRQLLYSQAPHFMILVGDDFTFETPGLFNKVDRVKELLKITHPFITFKYSKPSQYFKELSDWATAAKVTFKTYDGDFYAYGDPYDWWTGYYTSRPLLKGLARITLNDIRVAQQLSTSLFLNDVDTQHLNAQLTMSLNNFSIVQHHDAITGTSIRLVADDYFQRLIESLKISAYVSVSALSNKYKLQTFSLEEHTPTITARGSEDKALVVYNSLSWKRREPYSIYVRVPGGSVDGPCPVQVWNSKNEMVDFDCMLKKEYSNSILLRLDWMIDIPSMGSVTYIIKNYIDYNQPNPIIKPVTYSNFENAPNSISNTMVRVDFNPYSQTMQSVENLQDENDNEPHYVDQEIAQYRAVGGSYIFRPLGNAKSIVNPKTSVYYEGRFIKEVVTHHPSWEDPYEEISDTIITTRILEGSKNVQFDYRVRGFPNRDTIVRFNTSLNSSPTLYTDDGLNIIKRFIPYKETDTAEDYYPSISFAYLEQDNVQFVCTNDRSRGVSSTTKGGIEFMLHRSKSQDDGKGMGEPMLDDSVIVTKTQCYFDTNTQGSSYHPRHNAILLENPLKTFLVTVPDSNNPPNLDASFTPELSPYLYLMSMKKVNNSCLFLRLMNIDPTVPVELSIDNLITGFTPSKVIETDLSGHRALSLGSRIQFSSNNIPIKGALQPPRSIHPNLGVQPISPRKNLGVNFYVNILPLEIKAFYFMK